MKSALEALEAKTGRVFTVHDHQRAREKAHSAPGTLTDEEILVLDFFAGQRQADIARAAREKALGRTTVDPPAAITPTLAQLPAMREGESPEDFCLRCGDVAAPMSIVGAVLKFVFDINEKNKERNARLDALEAQNKELKADLADVKARPTLTDAGDWTHGKLYAIGAVVRHHASLWICKDSHYSVGEDLDHDRFKLWQKRSNQR